MVAFPALIHACGLAQAVAFAVAKDEGDYVADLATVLHQSGHPEIADADLLSAESRGRPLSSYPRLNRDALNAASWLKRYAEALKEDGPCEPTSAS